MTAAPSNNLPEDIQKKSEEIASAPNDTEKAAREQELLDQLDQVNEEEEVKKMSQDAREKLSNKVDELRQQDFVDKLTDGNETQIVEKLREVREAIEAARNAFRQQILNTAMTDINEDILQVGQDEVKRPEEIQGLVWTVRKLMVQVRKFRNMFASWTTFDQAKLPAVEAEAKNIRNEEFLLLGADGLRDMFRETAAKQSIRILNGKRDQQAFDYLKDEYFEGTMDTQTLVDKKIATFVDKALSGDTTRSTETTMFGLLAEKHQEVNEDRFSILDHEHEVNVDGTDMTLRCEENRLVVQSGTAEHVYAITGTLLKKDGTPDDITTTITAAELNLASPAMALRVKGTKYKMLSKSTYMYLSNDKFKQGLLELNSGDMTTAQAAFSKTENTGAPLSFMYPTVEFSLEQIS